MTGVGFVTGLAAEAALLSRLDEGSGPSAPRVACAGADSARAAAAAEALIAGGADALVSFGVAGGLDPALGPGALLLSEQVIAPDGTATAADAGWRRAVLRRAEPAGLTLAGGALAGSDAAVTGVGDKLALHRDRGALAVDMESHAVGRVAEAAGLPFLVLRAVADPAGRALPALVEGSIAANGRPRVGLVLGRLALAPWHLGTLLRLRRDSEAGLAALARALDCLGPALASHPEEA